MNYKKVLDATNLDVNQPWDICVSDSSDRLDVNGNSDIV